MLVNVNKALVVSCL